MFVASRPAAETRAQGQAEPLGRADARSTLRVLRWPTLAVAVVCLCAVHAPLIGYKTFANVDEAYFTEGPKPPGADLLHDPRLEKAEKEAEADGFYIPSLEPDPKPPAPPPKPAGP
jgi:hypothetical protein